VNKLNTQVELRFSLHDANWMGKELRERFEEVHANRVTKTGDLVLVCNRERTQESNIRDCLLKLKNLMEEASFLPKERKETKAPAWAKERRMEAKRFRTDTKKNRGTVRGW